MSNIANLTTNSIINRSSIFEYSTPLLPVAHELFHLLLHPPRLLSNKRDSNSS
ncbi:uncharacterized protein RHIMIDRAFT_284616 [Rhizopus microsporus ATCC 52813]|uniref:Uncharacterized protein n=1 Tax=Rhizopus microsporus ATCC 52813 TaxID=1340429 RepID=A0A2G4SU75_RHIZD|nr:uncharacterized protein RHIMIDRAFT_284616 [Rhizopus microsporus ATCC 52813]PHZ12338.1 hypothetical protein RHIMIDRAFT_284616 [Rhizopus microsporus ATCC 52813]